MTDLDDPSNLKEPQFSDEIDSLDNFLSQSTRVFLLGAGSSKPAGLPLTDELTELTLNSVDLDVDAKFILNAIKQSFDGSEAANIEDYLSELVDLLAISERRVELGATVSEVPLGGKTFGSNKLSDAVDRIKNAIAAQIDKEVSIDLHRRFVSAIHRVTRPGHARGSRSARYVVLNYDTLIEDSLSLENIPATDGLEGGSTGWWRPSEFKRHDIVAWVYKLHGSINWFESKDNSLPVRTSGNFSDVETDGQRLLIWPASTKYRETQLDPFSQLLEQTRAAIRVEGDNQSCLFIIGYSFSDKHINSEIEQAMRFSGDRLTTIVFSSEEQPVGQLKAWRQDPELTNQLRIYGKRGFFHGERVVKSGSDLQWWKFENIVRIIEGQR